MPKSLTRAVLVLSALTSIGILVRMLGSVRLGYDFTDEGYYLVISSAPSAFRSSLKLFGYFLHPLHALTDGNIAVLRASNFLITFALGFLFFDTVWRANHVLNPGMNPGQNPVMPRRSRGIRVLASTSLASSALAVFGSWIVTPSYNTVALHGCLLVASFSLLTLDSPQPRKIAPPWGEWISWIGIGLGGWVTFMGKPPAAAALAMLVLAFLLMSHRRPAGPILVAGGTATALLMTTAWSISGSLTGFIGDLLRSAQQASLMDPRYSFTGMFRLDALRISLEEVAFIAGVVLLGVGAGLPYGHSRIGAGARWTAGLILSIGAAVSLAGMDGGLIRDQRHKGLLILIAPILTSLILLAQAYRPALSFPFSALGRERFRLSESATGIGFLGLLPFAYAFGTANNLWINICYAAVFWVGAGLLLITRASRDPAVELSVDRLSAFAAVTVCVSTVLVMSAMRSPYRQTAPLGVSARPASVRGHLLEIEKTAADYLETVRSLSGAAGFRQDTPMLDFTGRSPGVLYAIGARSIGQGWMIGGYPGSNELTTRALTAVECGELVQAWLITEPGGGRRLSEAQILASFGIRFPEDYEEVAEWIVPAGKGWKAFEGRQKLFRPRRDSAEARVHCEAHRHLNRTS